MSVQNILGKYGVTMPQARDFLNANLSNPQHILDIASQFGISFSGLGEITGFSTADVQAFFANANLGSTPKALARIGLTPGEAQVIVDEALSSAKFADIFQAVKSLNLTIYDVANVSKNWTLADIEQGMRLSGLNPDEIRGTPVTPTKPLMSVLFLSLATDTGIMGPNTNSGALSTESLRNSVLSKGVSSQAYDAFFTPLNYQYSNSGGANNTINTQDIGERKDKATIAPATKETLESYFYGMSINALRSVDATERSQLGDFLGGSSHVDAAQMVPLLNLLKSTFNDPANPPAYSDSEMAAAIVDTTVNVLTGTTGTNAFFDLSLFLA